MSLSQLASGQKAKIVQINGGYGFRNRLIDMGLCPGREISVEQNTLRGPIVIKILNSKIMLGRGMADKIIVA
jgi:Fe2+ transport system protein FeoA